MSIDLNVIARVFKLVALFGFFLPWVAVSCSGTEIATGTGWQMMTGELQPSGALASIQQGDPQAQQNGLKDQEPSYFVIAAFAVVALALLASLVTRGKTAAGILLAGALVGAGLSFYTFEQMKSEMMHQAEKDDSAQTSGGVNDLGFSTDQQKQMRTALANAIQLEKKEGFWVTFASLLIAALLALVTVSGVRFSMSTPAPPPPSPS